jgi:hypothetical protein
MISVPGDKKILRMQKTLDDATAYAIQNKMKLRYVNGDCTKWSAAETMGSFIAMMRFMPIPDNFKEMIITN